MSNTSAFTEFLDHRIAASAAFVDGDVEPLLALSTKREPASIFPPNGRTVCGVEAVDGGNRVGAAAFGPDSENAFEELHSGTSGDLAYWVGVQRSQVRVRASGERVPMDLRLTELYRLEDGAWVLFHRHADLLQAS